MEKDILKVIQLLSEDTFSGYVNLRDVHTLCYGHYKLDAQSVTDYILYMIDAGHLSVKLFGGTTYVKLS